MATCTLLFSLSEHHLTSKHQAQVPKAKEPKPKAKESKKVQKETKDKEKHEKHEKSAKSERGKEPKQPKQPKQPKEPKEKKPAEVLMQSLCFCRLLELLGCWMSACVSMSNRPSLGKLASWQTSGQERSWSGETWAKGLYLKGVDRLKGVRLKGAWRKRSKDHWWGRRCEGQWHAWSYVWLCTCGCEARIWQSPQRAAHFDL